MGVLQRKVYSQYLVFIIQTAGIDHIGQQYCVVQSCMCIKTIFFLISNISHCYYFSLKNNHPVMLFDNKLKFIIFFLYCRYNCKRSAKYVVCYTKCTSN